MTCRMETAKYIPEKQSVAGFSSNKTHVFFRYCNKLCKALICEFYPFPEFYTRSRISWETYPGEQKIYFLNLADNAPPSEVLAVLNLKNPCETVTWKLGDLLIIPIEDIKLEEVGFATSYVKQMPLFLASVHLSTAYCNCDRPVVRETVYPPPVMPEQVTALVEALDENLFDDNTARLVGLRPNTYTFTKSLAESWLQDNHGRIPVAIVRPSIVLSSIRKPFTGWVYNWNGSTGIIAAVGKGVFRTMLCHPDKVADFVSVDMVINQLLEAGWRAATIAHRLDVFSCCTGQRRLITWLRFIDLCFYYRRTHPFSDVVWYPDSRITYSPLLNTVSQYLLHWAPAWLMDTAVWDVGGNPVMLKVQDKLGKAATCLEYFTTNQWQFEDRNVHRLYTLLSHEDKKLFNFDVSNIQWEEYVQKYVLGIRRKCFTAEF